MEGGSNNGVIPNTGAPRKIMVVADATRESAAALQYALSHVVLEQDELILLHVENTSNWRYLPAFLKKPAAAATAFAAMTAVIEGGGGDGDFLGEMKRTCKAAQPKVRVSVEKEKMEIGKDKAAAILSKSNKLGVDVIVIGQRRTLPIMMLMLGYKSMKGVDTAEYLIENSKCTCVGVQKKGQSAGYLLNTKAHRNFWLLA